MLVQWLTYKRRSAWWLTVSASNVTQVVHVSHLLITIATNTHRCICICTVYKLYRTHNGRCTSILHTVYCTPCTVPSVHLQYTQISSIFGIHYYVQLLLAHVRRCLQLRLNFNSTALQPFSVLCYVPYNAIIIIIKVTCSFFPAVVVYWSYTLSGDYL